MGRVARRCAKKGWRDSGWWAQAGLNTFEPLLRFANADLTPPQWERALWDAMGNERLLTSKVDGSITFALEVAGDEAETSRWTYRLPRISRVAATYPDAKELQDRVRDVLRRLRDTLELVYRQRNGAEDLSWLDRLAKRDVMRRRTSAPSSPYYFDLPWAATHFDEHQGLLEEIKADFGVNGQRSASVHFTGGLLFFDDAGEDASTTLAWILAGLVDVAFRQGHPVLKRCFSPLCEKYFLHLTLRKRTFCSDTCRYTYHNKGTGA